MLGQAQPSALLCKAIAKNTPSRAPLK